MLLEPQSAVGYRSSRYALASFSLIAASAFTLLGTPVGYLVGGSVHETNGSICTVNQNTIQPPLYAPYNRDNLDGTFNTGWWANVVEEATFSNVSYVALNIRGASPCGITPSAGDAPPAIAAALVGAI